MNADIAQFTPSPTKPSPLNFSRAQVSSLAESVRHQVGFNAGDDLFKLVDKLGGHVTHVDFWGAQGGTSGSIEIKDGRFEIRLPLDTGLMRDRFTIAHELGHYVLHYLYPIQKQGQTITWLTAERNGAGAVEMEANWFAAAFLMPEKEYKDEFDRLNGDQVLLAEHFLVSVRASKIRAKVLGLQSES